jgi:hypothetical protein
MELFGKIIAALPERSGVSARGNNWRSITYVLETQEQYPKHLAFDVTNDKITQLNIQVGEMINVQFDINARESNGRWFNSVQAWNVIRQQQQNSQYAPQQYYQQPIQGHQQPMPQQPAPQAVQPPFPPQQPQAAQSGSLPF